jgi:signal transduction histidine kinase
MPDGVCKITESETERYTTSEGLASNYVDNVIKSANTNHIITTGRKGVSIYDEKTWRPLLHNGLPFSFNKLNQKNGKQLCMVDNKIFELEIDFDNSKLVSKKLVTEIPHTTLEFDVDSAGAIHITTQRGMYRYFRNELTRQPDTAKIGRVLVIDSRNRMWIGGFTDNLEGYKINYENGEIVYKKIPFASSLPGVSEGLKYIRCINEDKENNLIVGTRFRGVFYLTVRNDSVVNAEQITINDGLLGNSVRRMDIDKDGLWWLVTENGINSVSGIRGKRIIKDESSMYGITRITSLICSDNDKIWLSNYPGIVALKKNHNGFKHPYQVHITSIRVNNQPTRFVTGTNISVFENHQNTISISYSANSFINEQAILYSYQLQNNGDTSWTAPSVDHVINYSSLNPGRYTFRVKAINQYGQWSTNISEFHFRIKAPFWQRGWFIALLIIAISGILFALYRYRIRQLTRLHAMRDNISRNLHDDIGSSLTNIHILNELAQRNLEDKTKAEGYISKSAETIQRISESLSDIVWNINPRYDNINHLLTRMKWYAAEMMDGKNIEGEIIFPELSEGFTMPMDQRRDFYLIFKELVNNMAKHSGATKAEITIAASHHKIELTVTDNGKGFDRAISKKGNGLESMQARAAKWNGEMEITTAPGKGTITRLIMNV